MPNASSNYSSIITKDERDEHKHYTQVLDGNSNSNITNTSQKKSENHTEDIHYATEDLLDGLPRLWTRGFLYVLLSFAILAIPWSIISKIDETGNAKGRIEPKGATQKIDSQASGSVKAVKIKEGDTVEAGQVLLELNTDLIKTEVQQIEEKFSGLLNQRSQLEVIKKQLQSTLVIQEQQNRSQALEKMSQVNQAQQNLDTKQNSYELQILEKQSLLNQTRQEINSILNDQKSIQARLKIDSRQVKRFSELVKGGAVSINQVEQLLKEEHESKRLYNKSLSDQKQAKFRLQEEVNRYQATVKQLQSDIEQAKLRLQEEQSSYQSLLQAGKLAISKTQEQLKDIEKQIAGLQSQIAQTRSQITSLKLQFQQRIVRSPIDGKIFEFPINKPGQVVKIGQRIARIAPRDTNYILKAQMPIQDSGFLKVGMPVKIKFDAYPFQEYGISTGKVTWISPDSKAIATPQGRMENFELEIALDKQYIQNSGKRIPIKGGQTATAEVIVRQRRVIDYVLDPFKRLQAGNTEL
ncbi:MAG: HlyD family efflux transporter periplasmic adaptor subunit [Cyanobacteria bacterium P01_A01_bin.45]